MLNSPLLESVLFILLLFIVSIVDAFILLLLMTFLPTLIAYLVGIIGGLTWNVKLFKYIFHKIN